MRFLKRENARLQAELEANRSQPSDEFVRTLAKHVADRSHSQAVERLSRVAYAASVTVLMVGMLVSFGGIGYAASAPARAVKAVEKVVSPERSRIVQKSSSQSQYEPRTVTVCHVLPNGKRVTITISESALPAHLRHDDNLGACPAGVAGVGGGVAGMGGGVSGAGGSGVAGVAGGGTLPFTGLSLLASLLVSSLLLVVGYTLRREASNR